MKYNSAIAMAVAVMLSGFGGAAMAKPALKDVDHVREGIITTGMALELSDKCSSLRPRKIRGINYLFSLRDHAYKLGYSGAEIDAYINDKVEERRLKQIARDRLATLGAVSQNASSYCAVGRAEIAKRTEIGRLLR